MTERQVHSIHPAYRDDIGDLVTRRPVPGPGIDRIGAFLFLNHHGPQVYPPNNQGLPFGPHPHRGFETVTFILDGELAHTDSAGHESIIRAGGVQWMTAGRGIIHAEVSPASFKRDGGPMEILQLWVNLPARLKMTAPRYTGVQERGIPVIEQGGGRLFLISGELGGKIGPVQSLTGIFMSWVETTAGASISFDGLAGRDVFLYAGRGNLSIGGCGVPQFHLAQLEDGGSLTVETPEPALFVFGHADPLDEPMVAHGPFVMNTPDEIREAFVDYQAGKFGKAKIVEA